MFRYDMTTGKEKRSPYCDTVACAQRSVSSVFKHFISGGQVFSFILLFLTYRVILCVYVCIPGLGVFIWARF